ncbi:MAG TPA: FAD-binding oxidoreductase [Gemmataceae bacterium]|nr:FAD-binding oxidoreductase [Gemmataceae bacterium]
MTDSCLIDDFGPLPLRHPASVPELADCVREAASAGQSVYPVGGGTALGYGLPPSRPGFAVSTTGLAQVIDYPARDMTITVQAGITLARLAEVLAAEKQRLPIDVPDAGRATLGGGMAVNASGPRRYGLGTLRDHVIGISVVNDEGQEVKAGGRVVKNVAGYDLPKLHVGALGTLGIISQVTLKLKPRPEGHALLTLGCPSAAVGALLDTLHRSRTRPVCLELLTAPAARVVAAAAGRALPDSPWVIVVGFEDNHEAVSWQVQQLIKEVAGGQATAVTVLADKAAEPLWSALVEFAAWPEGALTFKANVLPSAVADFCVQAADLPDGLLLQAHAGSGIVIGHAGADLTAARAAAMLKGRLATATAARGNLVVTRCPPAWKAALPVWGAPRGDGGLMRRVKDALDPRGLFNPGRFVV